MLNLLPELYQCNNGGFLPMALRHSMEALFSSSQSPQGAPPLGNGLTFTSPVLDGCWIGLAQLLQRAWLQATSPHRGVLSETIRSQTGDKCIQSGPGLSSMSTPTPAPLHKAVLFPGLSQTLPLQRKACLALGSPMLLPRPTLAGAGRIALHGSCCSQ